MDVKLGRGKLLGNAASEARRRAGGEGQRQDQADEAEDGSKFARPAGRIGRFAGTLIDQQGRRPGRRRFDRAGAEEQRAAGARQGDGADQRGEQDSRSTPPTAPRAGSGTWRENPRAVANRRPRRRRRRTARPTARGAACRAPVQNSRRWRDGDAERFGQQEQQRGGEAAVRQVVEAGGDAGGAGRERGQQQADRGDHQPGGKAGRWARPAHRSCRLPASPAPAADARLRKARRAHRNPARTAAYRRAAARRRRPWS